MLHLALMTSPYVALQKNNNANLWVYPFLISKFQILSFEISLFIVHILSFEKLSLEILSLSL